MFKSIQFFGLYILAWIFALPVFADHIIVRDAWVNEAPPVSRVNAAYLVISNNSSRDIVLHKVTSPDFARLEIHQSKLDGEQMKMAVHPRLVIGAKQEFQLAPGNFHLMMFKPSRTIRAGNIVKLTLYFDQDIRFDVDAVVRKHAP